jgi:hypothetical protein
MANIKGIRGEWFELNPELKMFNENHMDQDFIWLIGFGPLKP